MADYLKIFGSLDTTQKSDFLLKALANSETLQNQLIQYYGGSTSTKPASAKSFAARVQQASSRIIKIFKAIDLEEFDYDDHRPAQRYYEEWEIETELAEKEIQDVMSKISADLIKLIAKGDLEGFMVEFTGCLDAIMKAEIYDPRETLGDPEDLLLQEFKQLTSDCEASIKTVILNPSLASSAISMVIRWFQNTKASKLSTRYHDQICSTLLSMHGDHHLGEEYPFHENPEKQTLFSKTYLALLRFSDPGAWITESERLAASSHDIGHNLLEYLYKHNQVLFYKKAGPIFDLYPQHLVYFLATHIDPAKDHKMAIRVWEFKVLQDKALKDYRVLSGLFDDPSQKENLVKKLAKSSNYEFYVKVLTHEKMYDRILAMAQEATKFYYDFETLLAPIVKVYPEESFRIAIREVESEMKSDKLSRSTYNRIASLLKVINSNPAMKPEVRIYAKKLIEANPRRSALREELFKAGLMG
jgi:hypothetical protein